MAVTTAYTHSSSSTPNDVCIHRSFYSRVVVTFFNNNFVSCKATLKVYEMKYSISLNDVHTHNNNEIDKRKDVSKIATNISKMGDNIAVLCVQFEYLKCSTDEDRDL